MAFDLGHFNPGMRAVAGQFRLQDHQLAQAVGELRIFRLGRGIFDRFVETPEHLFEGVVVPFAVASWKLRVGPGGFLH